MTILLLIQCSLISGSIHLIETGAELLVKILLWNEYELTFTKKPYEAAPFDFGALSH
jgi:hypothetical protein